MLDQQKMAQTVFNLAKDYTDCTMQIMKTSMDQWEKTLNTLAKNGMGVQDENQKLFTDWINKAKQGQQQYWNTMEENIKKMETFFNTDWSKKTTKG